LGRTLTVPRGTELQDLLFTQGVEFPCGGRGRCKGCRVRVLDGFLPVSSEDSRLLSGSEIDLGWRLACQAHVQAPLTLELAQWEAEILSDDTSMAFVPREGLGVAVDLGTTTLVAQLLDLQLGNVLGVRTALNRQARLGADIMSRIEHAVSKGQSELQTLIREQIRELIEQLLSAVPNRASELKDIVLVGNTVMHHLFSGLSVEPLAHYPFEPKEDGLQTFSASSLGWPWARADRVQVRFLPCLGGFVGSDILEGLLSTGLRASSEPAALIDLGTNGEIVVGNRDRMLCASTAAGPAFEGARISMGMRAATGAISEVSWRDGQFHCRVLGQVEPRGICGSGLVDAVAAGLEAGSIQMNGRIANGSALELASPVALAQKDIRELQLAKGAIAAGFRILLRKWGARPEDISRLYLAGAFGNYVNRASAVRIGLLTLPIDRIEPAGNTALRGAKMALASLGESEGDYAELRQKVRHISVSEEVEFQDTFVEEMGFPAKFESGSQPSEIGFSGRAGIS
jgi:uncharacterized 2Fe-2S/4Fe-4S cluster protein (DUF4445 family)